MWIFKKNLTIAEKKYTPKPNLYRHLALYK